MRQVNNPKVTQLNSKPAPIAARFPEGIFNIVLIAEQLHAAGARLIVGLTSAGRLLPTLPLPSIVVADEAIRDEGTSLHYLEASAEERLLRWTSAGALALVALVSNSPADSQEQFDTGGHDYRLRVLTAIAKAARASLDDLWSRERHVAP
jgi:hypothetical protein